MFCYKCGTEIPATSEFCHKCGAKISDTDMNTMTTDIPETKGKDGIQVDDAMTQQSNMSAFVEQMEDQNQNVFLGKCKEKKSKKKIVLSGVIVLGIIAVIIALNWNGKTDYIGTVAKHTPFADTQGLPYTYEEVLNQYLVSAEWKVREEEDVHYVDIIGMANGAEGEIDITIKVTLKADDPDVVTMHPESVTFDGTYQLSEEETSQFLYSLFCMYDEGYEELSVLMELEGETGLALQGEINLTETFTDEATGISFRYPAGWIASYPTDERGIVMMVDPESTSESTVTFFVGVYSVSDPATYGVFLEDKETVIENLNYMTVLAYEDTVLEGNHAKTIKAVVGDTANYFVFYKVGEAVYKISYSYSEAHADIYEPIFEDIMNSYSINTGMEGQPQDDVFGYEEDELDYREAYSAKVTELSEADDSIQFALIDLIDNGVPELVADNPGYYVSVYTWVDEEVVTLMDQWGYGAGGNNGYQYLPGQNVIRNYNMDYAGAVIYESYMEVNSDYEITSISDEELSIWRLKDTNNNGMIDEDDEYTDEPTYYCNGVEVSEEEYASYQITGDYEPINGNMSADAMLDFIKGEVYEEENVMLSDFSNNSLYLYGGSYEGRNGGSLHVSVYSSFDEGNTLGNVTVNDSSGYEAFAYIRDEGEGEGIYALYYGDSIRMRLSFYQDHGGKYCADIQGLDEIYSNSNQIETYIMTEQYIP